MKPNKMVSIQKLNAFVLQRLPTRAYTRVRAHQVQEDTWTRRLIGTALGIPGGNVRETERPATGNAGIAGVYKGCSAKADRKFIACPETQNSKQNRYMQHLVEPFSVTTTAPASLTCTF